jgi:hypothetical protein
MSVWLRQEIRACPNRRRIRCAAGLEQLQLLRMTSASSWLTLS